MGIRMGEKNHKKAEQVLANSFLMLSVFSVLLTVSFLLLKDKLLMLFGASGATFPFANTYLTIYTTGTFFALMATGLNYFINCQGFPLVGMFTVLIGAGCNILSDPIFIFGFHTDIFCIQSHNFFEVSDVTSSAYLPHTSDSRFNSDSSPVM